MTRQDFETLYRKNHKKWVGMLVRKRFDRNVAEDAVQDLATEVLESPEAFTGTNLDAYLTQRVKLQARRLSQDLTRETDKTISLDDLWAEDEPKYIPDYDTAMDIDTVLADLDPSDQEFIEVMQDLNFSVTDTAQRMGLSLRTAERVWAGLRSRLSVRLTDYRK